MSIAGCDDVLSGLWLEMCGCPWVHMYQPWDDKEGSRMNNRRTNWRTQKTSSGHVSRRNEDHQSESWKQRLDKKTREAFQVHQLSPNVDPLETTKRQVKNSAGQLRDSCLRSSYDFPQSPEHCSPTKNARVSRCSHWNVVMMFCPSFTQSERFLQTDQLIIRLQVVVVTNFICMLMRNVFVNVFKSDAVVWWAVIFRTCRPFSWWPAETLQSSWTCPLGSIYRPTPHNQQGSNQQASTARDSLPPDSSIPCSTTHHFVSQCTSVLNSSSMLRARPKPSTPRANRWLAAHRAPQNPSSPSGWFRYTKNANKIMIGIDLQKMFQKLKALVTLLFFHLIVTPHPARSTCAGCAVLPTSISRDASLLPPQRLSTWVLPTLPSFPEQT